MRQEALNTASKILTPPGGNGSLSLWIQQAQDNTLNSCTHDCSWLKRLHNLRCIQEPRGGKHLFCSPLHPSHTACSKSSFCTNRIQFHGPLKILTFSLIIWFDFQKLERGQAKQSLSELYWMNWFLASPISCKSFLLKKNYLLLLISFHFSKLREKLGFIKETTLFWGKERKCCFLERTIPISYSKNMTWNVG